jgi:hypothetical protein
MAYNELIVRTRFQDTVSFLTRKWKKIIPEKEYGANYSFFPVCLYLFWGHMVA